jgi:hypothetical protein
MMLPMKWLIKKKTKWFSLHNVNVALSVHKNLKQVKQCKNLLMQCTGNF